jgi:hypothetical protein
MHLMPLLLSLLVGLLLGLIAWGIQRARSPEADGGLMGTQDDLLWGLLLLAGLAIVVFITFLLLGASS